MLSFSKFHQSVSLDESDSQSLAKPQLNKLYFTKYTVLKLKVYYEYKRCFDM